MTSTKPLSQLPFAVDNKFKLYLRGVLLLPQKKKRVFRPLFLLLRLAFNFILYLFHHGAMYGTAFDRGSLPFEQREVIEFLVA